MNEDAAVMMSRDPIALDMLLHYSKLCAKASHVPSAENFAAAENYRNQILQHSQQQAQILSQAVTRLAEVSRVAGADPSEAEAQLRALLGVS